MSVRSLLVRKHAQWLILLVFLLGATSQSANAQTVLDSTTVDTLAADSALVDTAAIAAAALNLAQQDSIAKAKADSIKVALEAVEIPEGIELPEVPEFDPTVPDIELPPLIDLSGFVRLLWEHGYRQEESFHAEQEQEYLDDSDSTDMGESAWGKLWKTKFKRPDLYVSDSCIVDTPSVMGYCPRTDLYRNTVDTCCTVKDTLLGKITTYGYHPFWVGDAWESYHFRLLSRIGYFSYAVDSKTGGHRGNLHSFSTTKMIDVAHSYGTKVDLVITCYGTEENKELLSNDAATDALINNVVAELKQAGNGAGADGVNVDFQRVPPEAKEQYVAFIEKLSKAVKKLNPNNKVSVTLPNVDWDQAYDVENLELHADYFIMMGYEFYGPRNKKAGPVSVLLSGGIWGGYSVDNSVNDYVRRGATSTKIILSVPYYGREWSSKHEYPASKKSEITNWRPYRYIKENYLMSLAVYDQNSRSNYLIFPSGKKKWTQFWYHDKQSIADRYDYVLQKNLGGAGIWALGYDNGHNELWELLREKFTLGGLRGPVVAVVEPAPVEDPVDDPGDDPLPADPDINKDSLYQVFRVVDPGILSPDTTVFQDHGTYIPPPLYSKDRIYVTNIDILEVIVLCLFILLGFGVIGFFFSMADHDVRELFWKRPQYVVAFIYIFLFAGFIVINHVFHLLNLENTRIVILVFVGVFIVLAAMSGYSRLKSSS